MIQNVATPTSPACLKQSTLQAIGFVCEEIVRSELHTISNLFYIAIRST